MKGVPQGIIIEKNFFDPLKVVYQIPQDVSIIYFERKNIKKSKNYRREDDKKIHENLNVSHLSSAPSSFSSPPPTIIKKYGSRENRFF